MLYLLFHREQGVPYELFLFAIILIQPFYRYGTTVLRTCAEPLITISRCTMTVELVIVGIPPLYTGVAAEPLIVSAFANTSFVAVLIYIVIIKFCVETVGTLVRATVKLVAGGADK